jgi:hypothetical protein
MSPLRVGFTHIFSLCLFLVAGLGILMLSILSVSFNQVELAEVDKVPFTHRFSAKILPGHVLYPFKAAEDRLGLFVMSQDQKCREMLNLSQERLEQAQALGEMGETNLAVITAFKGQRYITQALHQCPLTESQTLRREELITLVQAYQDELEHFETDPHFSRVALIGDIRLDNQTLNQQLVQN